MISIEEIVRRDEKGLRFWNEGKIRGTNYITFSSALNILVRKMDPLHIIVRAAVDRHELDHPNMFIFSYGRADLESGFYDWEMVALIDYKVITFVTFEDEIAYLIGHVPFSIDVYIDQAAALEQALEKFQDDNNIYPKSFRRDVPPVPPVPPV